MHTTIALPGPMRERLEALSLHEPYLDVPSTHFFGEDHEPRQSAVLIPLCMQHDEPCVLLTRRALHLSKHPGEYSFPGGSMDPEDETLLDTALRESFEEVTLPASAIEVLGYFASVPTMTDFQIAAFVGAFDIHTQTLRSDPSEVQHMAITPLSALCSPGVHHVTMQTHGSRTVPIHAFHIDPEQPIWGATAYLLHELLSMLGLSYA